MKYKPEIDGLRAVAVLPVMLFHAGFDSFSGGFVGVDIFFVISGYLITSIILSEINEGTFSFVRFYERRARRILPALFLVMLVCLPAAWLWLQPADMKYFSSSLTYVSLFASNLLFYQQSGYFGTTAELVPLLHTWSLAVEEQFYIIFPLLLMAIWRGGKRRALIVLSCIALLSLAWAQWHAYHKPAMAFYLLQARFWELMAGALLSIMSFARYGADECSQHNSARKAVAAFVGLGMIGYAILCYDKNTPFPGLYALVPVLGTVLVISCADRSSWPGRLLGSKVLVGIGLISYSAYLWHQPLLVFARHAATAPLSKGSMFALVVASLLLAYLSWRFVEQPFRDRTRVTRAGIFAFSVIGAAGFIGLGVMGQHYNGFETYYFSHRLTPEQRTAYSIIQSQAGKRTPSEEVDNGDCNFRSEVADAAFEHRFQRCTEKYGKGIIVLGDSHAINLYNALYKSRLGNFVVGVTQGGCHPGDRISHCQYDGFADFAARNRDAIGYVFYHEAGSDFISDRWGKMGSDEAFTEEGAFIVRDDKIAITVSYLDELSRDVRVIWLGPFVEARRNYDKINQFAKGFEMNPHALRAFAQLDSRLRAASPSEKSGWQYLSLLDLLQMGADSLLVNGCLVYSDSNHLSTCGERMVGEKLVPHLRTFIYETRQKP